jgi:chromosome segregation ATPase
MICCSDPNCAEEAGLTIQRQIDPGPVPYCHPHGANRQHALNQALENFRVVVVPPAAPPTELELAEERIAELEQALTKATGNTHGLLQPGAVEKAEQLETALRTLETQSRVLQEAREALEDTRASLQLKAGQLERLQSTLTIANAARVKAEEDLQLVTAELGRTRVELAAAQADPVRVEGEEPAPSTNRERP